MMERHNGYLRTGGVDRNHEDQSCDMLDYIVETKAIDMTRNLLQRVKDVILAGSASYQPKVRLLLQCGDHALCSCVLRPLTFLAGVISCTEAMSQAEGWTGKHVLLQIVANARNNIDIDKFEYIRRDSVASGLTLNYNFDVLLDSMKVSAVRCPRGSFCGRPMRLCCAIDRYQTRRQGNSACAGYQRQGDRGMRDLLP